MSRLPRYVLPNGLVEITNRTFQGRMLLKPSPALNQIALGVLARAQRLYEMPIHAVVLMSNHYHILASPPSAEHLSKFMGYFNTNLSKEISRLHGWKGPVWHRRYEQIPISEEEAAQVERLKYLLSHGCKENLVAKPSDWPGVHTVDAILEGKSLTGLWFDRTRECKNPSKCNDPNKYAEEEELVLTKLPAWKHLSDDEYRRQVKAIVEDISQEAEKHQRSKRTSPKGAKRIQRGHPHRRPRRLKSSPKPRFHAASRQARFEFDSHLRIWLIAYREASKEWREGNLMAKFPPWSFPPHPTWTSDGLQGPIRR